MYTENPPTQTIILALETSTNVCSIALYGDNEIMGEINLHKKNSHAEVITSSIEYLIKSSKIEMKDINAVAVSAGPGSYTGLRIGTSVAKGLCFALKIPLIAINTLEAMAFGMQKINLQKSLLCPMIDARRMEVYTTIINHKNEIILPICPMIIDHDSFIDILKDKEIIFFGDGSEKCIDLFKKNKKAIFIKNIYPSAINIAKMAYMNWRKKEFSDLESFSPIYLKEITPTQVSTSK